MKYEIVLDDIKKSYRFVEENGKKSLRHSPGKRVSILPYTTKFEGKHIDHVLDFDSVLGGFSRLVSGKELKEEFNEQDLMNRVLEKVHVSSENKTPLKSIVKELFFDNSGQIQIFHPMIFNYINVNNKNDLAKNLSKFLFNVLHNNVDEELKSRIKTNYEYQPDNVMLKLLIQSLPELVGGKNADNIQYKNFLPFVSELFAEDFNFMLGRPKFFIESFEMLLKYYYFFYVSQLSVKLKNMFNAHLDSPEEIYFNLDWESTSKTRSSFNLGWKLLSSNIGTLFSHANCLELLNHNKDGKAYSYTDIKDIAKEMTEEERSHLQQQIGYLLAQYKEYIQDVAWDTFSPSERYEEKLFQRIYELYSAIDFQFNRTTRKKPYQSYTKWFEEYCKANFLRKRGPLGYTLNITEDYLIFITRLCIKDMEKLRLKNLFEEYEKRGLFFDRDSRNRIIQLFEKLNLIEKKSDSGDAQYVKSIL
jgi:DNA phosphorothioation-dependent restriction protein DptG